MAKYTEYFHQITRRPSWFLGDRVSGQWNKIPFIGTVAIENCIDGETRRVIVMLDLPIQYKDDIYTTVTVKPRDLKKLILY